MVRKYNGWLYAFTVLVISWAATALLFIQPEVGLKTFPLLCLFQQLSPLFLIFFKRKSLLVLNKN
jgi:hypothetical protein